MQQQPDYREIPTSQIPAMRLLANLGFKPLTPEEVTLERKDKLANVLLEDILLSQLRKLNSFTHKGVRRDFSEENLRNAILKLKNMQYDGLVRTNAKIYDLLTLPQSEEESVEGDKRSYDIRYIDWQEPANNVFHAVAEFDVECSKSNARVIPDIVLFVNGIPFAVIENKSPEEGIKQGISQMIRNQGDEYIPGLFVFCQALLSVSMNAATYSTVGTPEKFWSLWHELEIKDKEIEAAINKKVSAEDEDRIFSVPKLAPFRKNNPQTKRVVTEQDRLIYCLCKPERLLEIAYRFTLFDEGIKKIARYQQFFVVHSALKRIRNIGNENKRKGGLVWHTQGSGKSLSMVMLARGIVLDSTYDPDCNIKNPRVVLVTDRKELDSQICDTFKNCGAEVIKATSGENLLNLMASDNSAVITTVINKFDKALNKRQYVEKSNNIFLLVDEAHRTQYKSLHARMKQMLPNACYIGFTGTPLMKKEKNSFGKFGGMLKPSYTIRQANEDGAVVPLLYEGRHAELKQDKAAIDLWFERFTAGLSDKQKADLKKKYARAEMLNKAERVVYMRAFDISEHFRANWKDTPFKAQLVAPSKETAILYHEFLDEIGHVSSEVIISGPDEREGYSEVGEEPTSRVTKFWTKMMDRYGDEDSYNKSIIDGFKGPGKPEILIVCDKLLTGFDAERNTVLYLCRTLKEHTLLQAIARVNRLFEENGKKKDFGYIVDYANVRDNLDTALVMYKALEGFDPEDLEGLLTDVSELVDKLPQLRSNLWDVFRGVKNKADPEQMERHLADEKRRNDFYKALRDFGKCLSIAMSSQKFLEKTPAEDMTRLRREFKMFSDMRVSVKHRYADDVDYSEYEPKIKKLLDTHIQSDNVVQTVAPVNILDPKFTQILSDDKGSYDARGKAASADTIAHMLKKTATEKMEEDPAFYEKFSKMIQDVIDSFQAGKISEDEYLSKVKGLEENFKSKKRDDVPAEISENEDAAAYYGVALTAFLYGNKCDTAEAKRLAVETALFVIEALKKHHKVQFWNDPDAQNRVRNELDDLLFDDICVRERFDWTNADIDSLEEKIMNVARRRSHE
ncbi:MAG: type I restriction endonuclease subunit R [Fibrobacter sp.]|uniref:type I restriction endonuclease subunit R n=1 Tax=Fibrobacter sp. TaxID=35828 RepID=UPI0025C6F7F2|nr:HsdR family type I site-specific deoxyribonuclease [Fibrobacter sp.]MBQ3714943.1 type I restriction endonuclease subunit R [Fibrobacter sp.]MBQ7078205.1 type I restriction endonuclease subunit R [Fibrobacter sp.]